jgi:hypothetical protein
MSPSPAFRELAVPAGNSRGAIAQARNRASQNISSVLGQIHPLAGRIYEDVEDVYSSHQSSFGVGSEPLQTVPLDSFGSLPPFVESQPDFLDMAIDEVADTIWHFAESAWDLFTSPRGSRSYNSGLLTYDG